MSALFDETRLTDTGQRAELYDDALWIVDASVLTEIKLTPEAATRLFDFLLRWQGKIQESVKCREEAE